MAGLEALGGSNAVRHRERRRPSAAGVSNFLQTDAVRRAVSDRGVPVSLHDRSRSGGRVAVVAERESASLAKLACPRCTGAVLGSAACLAV